MSKLKVFFNKKQSTNAADDTFSPSAAKPELLVQHWLATNQSVDIVSDFAPTTLEQLYRAHEKYHVDDVLACRTLNGFYTKSPEISATLAWTTGSFLAAAIHAFENKTIAMSPTSGFHHAKQDESMGYCTFNGLMVAALELLDRGAKRVGILDLDHHYGNGTDSIIEWLVESNKLLKDSIHHYTVGGDTRVNFPDGIFGDRTSYSWRGGTASQLWMKLLPSIIESFDGCDIILYQAGADPHVDDPCHKMLQVVGALTNEQLAARDQMVFQGLSSMGIPIAWNLAGGYQKPIQKVLDIHTTTLRECLKTIKKVE